MITADELDELKRGFAAEFRAVCQELAGLVRDEPFVPFAEILARLHGLKGTAASLGLQETTELLHGAEATVISLESQPASKACEEVAALLTRLASSRRVSAELGLAEPQGRRRIHATLMPITGADVTRVASQELRQLQRLAAATAARVNDARTRGPLTDDEWKQLSDATEQLQRGLQRLGTVRVEDVFRRAAALAEDLWAGQPTEIAWAPTDATVEPATADALHGILIQALRNCAAHAWSSDASARRVTLSASVLPEALALEISDNGVGIDIDALRTRYGLAHTPAVEVLTHHGAASTKNADAESARLLAGRGVGMRAIRDAVQGLGGRTELDSTPGVHTTLRLLLPMR